MTTKSDVDALTRYREAEKVSNAAFRKFARLDFDVFNSPDWDRIKGCRCGDIRTRWPDGTITAGLAQRVEGLKTMFAATPDFHVSEHPIRVGHGEWTSVIAVVDASFTQPMPRADRSVIAPTGGKLHMAMCMVGHWTGGLMDEEYFFWDPEPYSSQHLDR